MTPYSDFHGHPNYAKMGIYMHSRTFVRGAMRKMLAEIRQFKHEHEVCV